MCLCLLHEVQLIFKETLLKYIIAYITDGCMCVCGCTRLSRMFLCLLHQVQLIFQDTLLKYITAYITDGCMCVCGCTRLTRLHVCLSYQVQLIFQAVTWGLDLVITHCLCNQSPFYAYITITGLAVHRTHPNEVKAYN